MTDHSSPTDPPTFWQYAYARRSVMVVDVVDTFLTMLVAIVAVIVWTPAALVAFLAWEVAGFFVLRRVKRRIDGDDVIETTAEEANRFRQALRVAEFVGFVCVVVLATVLHG